MRVAINALAVPSCRQGGAGFYTATLIDGLTREDEVGSTALVSEQVAGELRELAPAARTEIATSYERPLPRKALNYLTAARRPWTLDLGLSAAATDADLVHWPISYMNGPAPVKGARRVLTVLDLQHEFYPAFFSRTDRILRRLRFPPSARAADHVITISEFSRETICERYGVPEDRITSVPLAARTTLAEGTGPGPLPEELRGLDQWFFYPASPLGAKNHARLLDAFKLVVDRGNEEGRLVLSGPIMHPWEPVERAIAERGLGERVIRLGHVGDRELISMYAQATGLIFPSLFEGFGLPVLEAMEAGCPVAVSGVASLPEILGGSGRTFDPEDVEEIAGGIEWLAGLGPAERAAVAEEERRQAARFSVERMIEGTMGVYRRVLG